MCLGRDFGRAMGGCSAVAAAGAVVIVVVAVAAVVVQALWVFAGVRRRQREWVIQVVFRMSVR